MAKMDDDGMFGELLGSTIKSKREEEKSKSKKIKGGL